jgi:hypothetical protein
MAFFRKLKAPQRQEMADSGSGPAFVISDKTRQMQMRMKEIFERQKNAGGIISENDQEVINLTVGEEAAGTGVLAADKLDMELLNLTS